MRKNTTRIKANQKFAFILFAFMFAIAILFGRILFLKVVHGQEYEAAVRNQQINRYDVVLTADRGSILDRNEQVLAISTAVYNVVLDSLVLSENDDKQKEKTISTLCEYFPELDAATLRKYITVDPSTGNIYLANNWKYLVKSISRELKEELEEKSLKGVYYEQTSQRSYPLKTVGCHLIGFTRGDTQWGIERHYNDYMVGTPGRSFLLYQEGDSVAYQDYAPQDGDTVITTIDYTIQQYTEEVVNNTAAKWSCDTVAAIVMDPSTGEILSMAQSGGFDLNNPSGPPQLESDAAFREQWEAMEAEEQMEYLNKMWTNFSISSTYEPGSIYKPLVIAAALEEGVISKSDTFYCSGSMDVSGEHIRCHLRSGHGTVTVEDIMAYSCNVGTMQIAQKLGADKFYEYQKSFGFGEKTGIDLPGEGGTGASLMHAKSAIGPVELATMSFGQTFNCTSIQMITAFAASINGGEIMEPHVVSQILDEAGNIVYENKPETVRKVISQATSDYIRVALKATVERGTGKKIQIEGYSIGCKTGTAEQGSRNRNDLWTLTHVSYFPAENPQYIIFAIMHLPEGYADGVQSTAPMTKELMEKIIRYKNLEPTEGANGTNGMASAQAVTVPNYVGGSTYSVVGDLDSRELMYKVVGTGNTIVNQVPKEGAKVDKGSEIILYVEKSQEDLGTVTVPNVVGSTYSEASTKLIDAGFGVVFEGEEGGKVSTQKPRYGVSVEKGSEVTVTLVPVDTTPPEDTEPGATQ